MNDNAVRCQNASVTEPQRDGGGEADGEGMLCALWSEITKALPYGFAKSDCFRGVGRLALRAGADPYRVYQKSFIYPQTALSPANAGASRCGSVTLAF